MERGIADFHQAVICCLRGKILCMCCFQVQSAPKFVQAKWLCRAGKTVCRSLNATKRTCYRFDELPIIEFTVQRLRNGIDLGKAPRHCMPSRRVSNCRCASIMLRYADAHLFVNTKYVWLIE